MVNLHSQKSMISYLRRCANYLCKCAKYWFLMLQKHFPQNSGGEFRLYKFTVVTSGLKFWHYLTLHSGFRNHIY